MRLYIIRHGIAEDAAPGQPDRDRVLTSKGIKKLKRQASLLARTDLPLDHLLTSPFLRSRQTADLLAPAFGAAVEEDYLLAPGCSLADLEELARRYDGDRLAIVGHEPDLSELVETLTGASVKMRKGTIAILDVRSFRQGEAVLLGLYDPDVMLALGGKK